DLAVKDDHLIAATQGRSFWILVDLPLLRQHPSAREEFYVFQPANASRMTRGSRKSLRNGTNHPGGLTLFYHLLADPEKTDTVCLIIRDETGDTLVHAHNHHPEKELTLNPAKG